MSIAAKIRRAVASIVTPYDLERIVMYDDDTNPNPPDPYTHVVAIHQVRRSPDREGMGVDQRIYLENAYAIREKLPDFQHGGRLYEYTGDDNQGFRVYRDHTPV